MRSLKTLILVLQDDVQHLVPLFSRKNRLKCKGIPDLAEHVTQLSHRRHACFTIYSVSNFPDAVLPEFLNAHMAQKIAMPMQ